MAITFGWVPLRMTLALTEGSDFVSALVASVDWPVDTTISLVLSGGAVGAVTWWATVAGNRADWAVDAVDVQSVITAHASTAKLVYTTPDWTLVWMEGPVNAHRTC